MAQAPSSDDRISKMYQEMLVQFFVTEPTSILNEKKRMKTTQTPFDLQNEKTLIAKFLTKSCSCGCNCQQQFSEEELLGARRNFRSLSSQDKNCYILGQLSSFLRNTGYACSARMKTSRQRQKFEYKVNANKEVCRDTFLFYHGETVWRLKRLQECVSEHLTQPPIHGNKGQKPANAYGLQDKEFVKLFIMNLAETHGLADPGRDVRKGKGRLRILLPSIMNYTSVHQLYEKSIQGITAGSRVVGYQSFLRIWQDELPHIEFNNPKTDLCETCENFKKEINRLTSSLEENKDELRIKLHKEALDHLNYAWKERIYYKAHSKVAKTDFKKISQTDKALIPSKANSKDIVMSYSWDFAQQVQYPFEDQQVGPIFFKTPRRAQLFGVCCEGSTKQINYLIDEADFLEKNANTVISLLDHFFSNYGYGERSVYLTADNCVGQNKNNALIQYLMYRILSNLHNKIEMSFLVVGHTKFSPDSHFGLIKQRYRNSKIYTYEQLAKVIEESADESYNICHRYASGQSGIIYRDWTNWLSEYFRPIPNITSYQHFVLDSKEPEVVRLKKDVNAIEEKANLTKGKTPFDQKPDRVYPTKILTPTGLSAERQWYLYEHIREHIVSEEDKDCTCPKPACTKPKIIKKPADN